MRYVFRAHNPRWSWAPDSGAGAARAGGRFNAVGSQALYTSFRFQTAWLEAQQGFPFKPQPMTLCAYDVACEDVLDLTDPSVLAAHHIKPGDLACPWEDLSTRGLTPPSWTLAQDLATKGVAAIIVPSFAAGSTVNDINVVFWNWSPAPPHQVRVIDDHGRLPHTAASWQ
jgi:RES domain-containing protein